MAPSLTPARRLIARAVRLLSAAVLVAVALSLTTAGAFGAGGRLQLYLVNSGPATDVYPISTPCEPSFTTPAELSTSKGSSVRNDSPGYAFFLSDPHQSIFSYTVPAGGGFTVPASPDAVALKLWAFTGDGSCPGQDGDQTIDWRVLCSGTCGADVSLSGAGQLDKPGWQEFNVPAGTPLNSLFNDHAGPPSAVTVSAGDVISLEVSADTWSGIQWSAPKGGGLSSLSILGK
jgi:hypothetical protein